MTFAPLYKSRSRKISTSRSYSNSSSSSSCCCCCCRSSTIILIKSLNSFDKFLTIFLFTLFLLHIIAVLRSFLNPTTGGSWIQNLKSVFGSPFFFFFFFCCQLAIKRLFKELQPHRHFYVPQCGFFFHLFGKIQVLLLVFAFFYLVLPFYFIYLFLRKGPSERQNPPNDKLFPSFLLTLSLVFWSGFGDRFGSQNFKEFTRFIF